MMLNMTANVCTYAFHIWKMVKWEKDVRAKLQASEWTALYSKSSQLRAEEFKLMAKEQMATIVHNIFNHNVSII